MFTYPCNNTKMKSSGILRLRHKPTKKCLTIPSDNFEQSILITKEDLKNRSHFSKALQFLYDSHCDQNLTIRSDKEGDNPFEFEFYQCSMLEQDLLWESMVEANFLYELVQFRSTPHLNLSSMSVDFRKLINQKKNQSPYPFNPLQQVLSRKNIGFGNYSGIYRISIEDELGKYIYVGKSQFIAHRWAWHLRDLLQLKHHNPIFNRLAQTTHRYFTALNLDFEILEIVNHYDYALKDLETKWAKRQFGKVISKY
ncbi:MAG: hypothetical protein ACRCXZ_02125 [Patescibacteria group bacterium]